jgi:glycosyltransferase involved in cell wall biosynthesis
VRQTFVSVLVPVRNEERYIERCLYSLARQDDPRDLFENIVNDGGSTDATPQIVMRFAHESTLDVRLLTNDRMLPAPAMNIGLAAARGDVIVRLDGHAAAAPDFLSASVRALDRSGADCVGGVIASEGDTYAGGAIALAMSSRFGVGDAAFRTGGEGPADTVAFGAYRRDVFDRVGGYAEDIPGGEDDELNYRLLDAGGSIELDPDIRTSYTVRGGLRGLWRQYFAYGRAKPEVLARHPAQARARQLVPAIFVLTLSGAAVRSLRGDTRPLRNVATPYLASAGAASLVAAAAHNGWRYLPLLPAAFACMHVAYGSGFIAGALALGLRELGAGEPAQHTATRA